MPGIFGRGRRRGKGRCWKVQVNDRDNLPARTATLLAFHGTRTCGRGESIDSRGFVRKEKLGEIGGLDVRGLDRFFFPFFSSK